jgi:hypothetical protein
MRTLVFCILFGICASLQATDDIVIGRSDPPFVEATVTIPIKVIGDMEKRADMVSDLAEKSEMNYRLLGMKITEKWQSSVRADKTFLKNLRQYKKVAFTVHEDGSIKIQGVEEIKPPDKATKGKKAAAKQPPPKPGNDN